MAQGLEVDELPEGRVKTVSIGRRSLAMTHFREGYGALDNRCPHQGGPLGEGSIEKGWLRCPWHGYDYSPCNGIPRRGSPMPPPATAPIHEVQNLPARPGQAAGSPLGRLADRRIAPPAQALAAAGERIASSRRPLFIAGNGARHT